MMSLYECYLRGSVGIDADSEDEAKELFMEYLKSDVDEDMICADGDIMDEDIDDDLDDDLDELDKYNREQDAIFNN